MDSIKRIGYISFVSVAALLILVIIMGFRQYQLSERYNRIITESEAMIFQFSTLREQITTALIGRDWQQVDLSADQLKNLNSSLSRIQENPLIPAQYRLDLAKQADIGGVAILAKEIPVAHDKLAKSLDLQKQMRSLAEYLIRFDRIIVSQMRAKVIGFQTVMIGALAAVICLISFSLTLFHKKTMLPLFHLAKQIKQAETEDTVLTPPKNSSSELTSLVHGINDLLSHAGADTPSHHNVEELDEKLATTLNQSTNLANGIINYAQLLADSYREVEMGVEERKILETIIETAEQIARLNKEL